MKVATACTKGPLSELNEKYQLNAINIGDFLRVLKRQVAPYTNQIVRIELEIDNAKEGVKDLID
jgi:hypothetical protein